MNDLPPPPGSEREAVLALDNIAVDLPIAGVGSRALAAALDYLVVTVLAFVLVMGTVMLMAVLDLGGGWAFAALILVLFLVDWGYFVAWEVFSRGRTLGKMAVYLRVVGQAGGTPSFASLVIRNLVRSIDIVVGVPLIATDGRGRRLGDRLAGTVVVHDRPPETEVTLGQVPASWGAREVALAESFLLRATELEPERARLLGERLMQLIERDAPELAASVQELRASAPQLAAFRALEAQEVNP